MRCLFQRYWHTSVRRNGEELLMGKTDYFDTKREIAAWMMVNVQTFNIQEAVLAKYRAPGEIERKVRSIPGLQGVKAYFGSGPRLREGLKEVGNPLAASLFAEIVRGIIQAETFLLKERGFASVGEYGKYWDNFYAGSCRYYSNLDRVSQSWSDYVGSTEREGNLFVRFKSQHLYKFKPHTYLITGNLSDSFHEMSVCLEVNERDRRVLAAEGELMRIPDKVCKESTAYLQKLVNLELAGLSKKEIAGLLGKAQGCVHLIDVVYDAAETLALN